MLLFCTVSWILPIRIRFIGDLIDGLDSTTIAKLFPINPKMAKMLRSTPSIANLKSGSGNNMIIIFLSRNKLEKAPFLFRDYFSMATAAACGLLGLSLDQDLKLWKECAEIV